jgi:hypothetical protein
METAAVRQAFDERCSKSRSWGRHAQKPKVVGLDI